MWEPNKDRIELCLAHLGFSGNLEKDNLDTELVTLLLPFTFYWKTSGVFCAFWCVSNLKGIVSGNAQPSFACKNTVFDKGGTVLVAKKFVLNCFKDKDMDVKASAFIDSSAEIDQGFFS